MIIFVIYWNNANKHTSRLDVIQMRESIIYTQIAWNSALMVCICVVFCIPNEHSAWIFIIYSFYSCLFIITFLYYSFFIQLFFIVCRFTGIFLYFAISPWIFFIALFTHIFLFMYCFTKNYSFVTLLFFLYNRSYCYMFLLFILRWGHFSFYFVLKVDFLFF